MKKLLIILLLFLLTSCGPNTGNNISSLPDCVKTKCNCTDFQKQEEAQLVLDAYPEDPYKLDRDKNGIACESLPATRKPSSYVNLRFGSPKQASSTDLNNYLIKK